MDFCDGLQKLAEAMDRINRSWDPVELHRWMDDFRYGLQEVMKSPDRPEQPKEKQNPMQMIGSSATCSPFPTPGGNYGICWSQ